MVYHILNGDAIGEKFPTDEIPGHIIVIREAFIEGPLSKEFTNDYWEKRNTFVSAAYAADKHDYEEQFLSQLHLLDAIKQGDDVFLWFEDDLFCLVNMWFTIYYLSQKPEANLYRIFPDKDDVYWTGFAKTNELKKHFDESQIFDKDEISLSHQLWEAYVDDDREKLKALSHSDTTCYRFLPQVIQAHLDRNPEDGSTGRPQQTLINILNKGKTNFYEIFEDFWEKEAIYGFGDLQVYNMLREMEIEFENEPG